MDKTIENIVFVLDVIFVLIVIISVQRNKHKQKPEQMNVQAFLDLKANAEKGDTESQYKLGQCYASGNDVQRNDLEAIKWFLKAAEKNHAGAQLELGCYYFDKSQTSPTIFNGMAKNPAYSEKSCEKYYNEAMKWFRKSADLGNEYAQCNLANMEYKAGNYIDAYNLYKKSANQGNASALFHLGDLYFYDKIGDKNYKEAVNYYRMAVKRGEYLGELMLGHCYFEGKGVKKSHFEAMKHFHISALHGFDAGRYCFREGANVFDYIFFFFYDVFILAKKPLVTIGIIGLCIYFSIKEESIVKGLCIGIAGSVGLLSTFLVVYYQSRDWNN